MHSILIIDDEQAICTSLMFALEDQYQVFATTSPVEGLAIVRKEKIGAVLLDMRIAGVDGLSLIPGLLEISPKTSVIVMTAFGTIETSVNAMKLGAYHYLTKPLNLDEVRILIEKSLHFNDLKHEVERLHEVLRPEDSYAGIIGKSHAMKNLFGLIDKVKRIDSGLLITGESGTGKELVAKVCHEEGIRQRKPFSALNCAAIPETLLESELFGHEKGAFTGAFQRKEGIFEQTHGGTIFLDEIGEMPLHLQAKLLRVIQEREVVPIGSNRRKQIDVRIIAATNRNLFEEVSKGAFREDLYYRLNVIPVHVPPLRERIDDLPLLTHHFLQVYGLKLGKTGVHFHPSAMDVLYRHSFPGNVRELSNIIEYAVALSNDTLLNVHDLPVYLQERAFERVNDKEGVFLPSMLTLEEAEREFILHKLQLCNGHRKKTAEALEISERGLRDKLNKFLPSKD
ncbi:sigma-54-dependent transcriptional regulator [Paenibacillus piri]|uniref:Sigma-54-dependent Fis family transcriptional regulator n=1 Tax=Paenibacillus piri TaxID=2547395 RepID=A0A4R5KWG7_9BACL|nr:sigma-54 dependent transcriptional regulator [Paenibacillus piri]TDG00370.1 sigma-54-dependent Fis family transcriptional regulator [Paenibacillus piri]